jgi:hypothetical protein
MVLQRTEPSSLEFLADELLLEHDAKRVQEMSRHLFMHAFYKSDLGPYTSRLLGFSSADYTTQMNVSKALATHAYNTDDGTLLATLLEGPHRVHALQTDVRMKVGPSAIGAMITFAEAAEPAECQKAFIALGRLGAAGADLQPAFDLLCGALGKKPSGRGFKRLDLDAHARGALATIKRPLLRAELERRAPTSKGAKAFLDTL